MIEGSLVHYETTGRGRPVVFLHGWLGSWRYWMHAMEEVSGAARAYAFDLWGFGDTDRSKGRRLVGDFAHQLEGFLEAMGIGRITLVGHALGAATAIKFAGLQPARVERLMAVSLPLSSRAVNRKGLAGGWSPPGGYRWQDYDELVDELKKADPSVLEPSIASLDEADLPAGLSALTMPTLLVHGARDPLVKLPAIEPILARNGNVHLIQFDDSRHFPMLEERGKFDRLIKDFLAAGDDVRSLELKDEWRRRTR